MNSVFTPRHGNAYAQFFDYKPSIVAFYHKERGILLRELTLVAISSQTGSIIALGNEVAENMTMIEREGALIGSPLKNGIVAEYDLAEAMFRYFFRKANVRKLFKPRIAVCSPLLSEMTSVEERALFRLMYSIGVKENSLLLFEESYDKAIQYQHEWKPEIHRFINKYEIFIEIMPVLNTTIKRRLIDYKGEKYEYLGNGCRTTGGNTWKMSNEVYFRCIDCDYMMDGDPLLNDNCLCGNLYKDSGHGRFGSNHGDNSIEVYRRV